MIIYAAFMIIILSLIGVYEITKKNMFYWIATVIMCLFSGLRYAVGTDYFTYQYIFENSGISTVANFKGGKGFLVASKLINYLTNNTEVHFFIFSVFMVFMIMFFIFKKSQFKFLSVSIYLGLGSYFVSFNIMRQYIAIGIVVIVIDLLDKKYCIRYYIVILIAATFHATALIMIPVKIVFRLKWTKKVYFIILVLGIGFYLNVNTIVSALTFDKRMAAYANGYYTNTGANKITFLVYAVVFIFCGLNSKKIKGGINNKYFKLMFIGLIFTIVGMKALIIVRMAAIFNLGILIVLPEVVVNLEKNKRLMVIYITIVSLIAYGLILISKQGNLIPYRII